MFAEVLHAPIWWRYATKISILDARSDPRSAYVTDTVILFSKWLFYIQSSGLYYQYIGLPLKTTQTQGNLVKELHLNCCSSPTSRAFQICMRRRSEEDISFKYFKKRQTYWELNFAYYCFSVSDVRNLLCWLIWAYVIKRTRAQNRTRNRILRKSKSWNFTKSGPCTKIHCVS